MYDFAPCWKCLGVMLVLLSALAGCGSKANVNTSGNDSDEAAASAGPAAPAAPGMPDAAGHPSAQGGPAGGPMDAGGPDFAGGIPPDGAARQPALKLPDDVSDWKPDDYRNAARAVDERLKPAIEQLVDTTPGDDETAELIAELLTLVGKQAPGNSPDGAFPGGPAQPAGPAAAAPAGPAQAGFAPGPMPGEFAGGNRQSGGDAHSLIRALITGLAVNGSPQALEVMTQVMSGEIETIVDQRTINGWVLTEALDNYGGDDHPTHELLEQALLKPQQLSDGHGKELRRQLSEIVAGTAASVIDHLMGIPIDEPSKRGTNQGFDPAEGPMPGGFAGPGNQPMPGAAAAGGPMAPGIRGGETAAGDGGGHLAKQRPLSEKAVQNAIQYLWRSESVERVASDIASIGALGEEAETFALAGALPMSQMRKATFDVLNERWQQGAAPLISRQLYNSAVRDPGLIVVLKQLPRMMPKGSPAILAAAAANPQASKSARQSMAKYTWMVSSALLVRAVTDRLRSTIIETDEADPPDLPIKLHKDARVLGVREINWPADLSDLAADVTAPGPLSLKYVQMSLSYDVPKTFQFYKKQLRRSKEFRSEQVVWIDSLTAGSKPGTRRSIDVVFTPETADGGNNPAGPNAGAPGGPAQGRGFGGQGFGGRDFAGGGIGGGQQTPTGKITLEILIVEIPDPKLASAD